MTYYLITDNGTQWFHYLISKDGDKVVDVFPMDLPGRTTSTLLSNIYQRETKESGFRLHDARLCNGSWYYGWSISELEFTRIKRMLELAPAVKEFEKIKDSV